MIPLLLYVMGTQGLTYLTPCTSYKAVWNLNRGTKGYDLRKMLVFDWWLFAEMPTLKNQTLGDCQFFILDPKKGVKSRVVLIQTINYLKYPKCFPLKNAKNQPKKCKKRFQHVPSYPGDLETCTEDQLIQSVTRRLLDNWEELTWMFLCTGSSGKNIN